MKNNKGFTLIELLAVIVILAIIALITTPIVLNIINQSKEAANKRSVEAYAKAVEYAVMQYEYKHNGELPQNYAALAADGISVEYANSDVTCVVDVNSDKKGTVKLCNCKVGNYSNSSYKYAGGKGNNSGATKEATTTLTTTTTGGTCN